MTGIDDIVKNKIGFAPEKSFIKQYPSSHWKKFLTLNELSVDARGIYDPKKYQAHVLNEEDLSLITSIHEYYGHGTFYEQSLLGKEMIRALNTKEERIIHSVSSKTWNHSEGFAMWMEDFVSESIGNKVLQEQFLKSINSYGGLELQAYAKAKDAESIGDFYFRREYGFPDTPTTKNVKEFIDKKYQGTNIRLAILYGSKKPSSDVDLFIVSDDIKTYRNHWLDVYSVDNQLFDKSIDDFLINITDPLFSGEVIIGHNEVEKAKQRVMDNPITDYSIIMNKMCAYKEQKIIDSGVLQGKDLENSKGYVESFQINAISLGLGNKSLTKQNIFGGR